MSLLWGEMSFAILEWWQVPFAVRFNSVRRLMSDSMDIID